MRGFQFYILCSISLSSFHLGQVASRVYNAVQRINRYPVDTKTYSVIHAIEVYPADSVIPPSNNRAGILEDNLYLNGSRLVSLFCFLNLSF